MAPFRAVIPAFTSYSLHFIRTTRGAECKQENSLCQNTVRNRKDRPGAARAHRTASRRRTAATPMRYEWPGNVRELENCIQRAVVLSQRGTITAELLPEHIRAGAGDRVPRSAGETHQALLPLIAPLRGSARGHLHYTALQLVEKALIEQVLAADNRVQTRTAREPGISRNALRTRMKTYGLMGQLAGSQAAAREGGIPSPASAGATRPPYRPWLRGPGPLSRLAPGSEAARAQTRAPAGQPGRRARDEARPTGGRLLPGCDRD